MSNLGATPTGNPPMQPQHIPWLTGADYINYPTGTGIQITDQVFTSGALDNICAGACAWIESHCGRYFFQQTIDEVFPDVSIHQTNLVRVPIANKPILNINSIYLQVLKYFILIAQDYMTVYEQAGYITFIPLLTGSIADSPIPTQILQAGTANVWVNYEFGYIQSSIPADILQASILTTTMLIANQDNPSGASQIRTEGVEYSWRQMKGQKDPIAEDIESLLIPHMNKFFMTTV